MAEMVPVRRADWSRYEGPGAEVLRTEQSPPPDFPDPLEPWNRVASIFNHGVMLGVIDPLATAYRFVVPSPVRRSIQRFSTNLLYPRRALAFLLQAEASGAWDETKRFGVNSTLGVLGFFDPASRLGIPASDEDFGQVFGHWGWDPSRFLVVPFFGPSTLRDAVGLGPDSLTNPTFYLPYFIGSALLFNEQADLVVPYKRFVRSTYDPYHLARLLWTLDREKRVVGYRPRPADTAAVQTLQIAFLSVHDPEFELQLSQGSVTGAGGRELLYSYRLQPGPAPIVYLGPSLTDMPLCRAAKHPGIRLSPFPPIASVQLQMKATDSGTLSSPTALASRPNCQRLMAGLVLLASAYWAVAQPLIRTQPANATMSLGATAPFRVLATSTNPPIVYQWWFNDAALDAVANPSATTNALSLTNVTLAEGGPYYVVVSDLSVLAATSQVATLTVDPTFVKVTGLGFLTTTSDSAWPYFVDYDDDGWLEVVVTRGFNHSPPRPMEVYENNRNDTFTRITNGLAEVRVP